MQYCDRCRGSRPHSTNGKCMAMHRTTRLATVTPMKRTPLKSVPTFKTRQSNDCGCTAPCETGCVLYGGTVTTPEPKARRPKLTQPKPRRTFDQTKVRAVVAALLAGELTVQQGCRDIGCDVEYLHRRAWTAAKNAVSKRDDGRCQIADCVTDGWVKDTHHRIGKGSGGASNPLVAYYLPNLIMLCRTHHRWVTENPTEATALGMVIPRGIVHDPSHVPVQTIHGLVMLTADGGRRIVGPPGDAA